MSTPNPQVFPPNSVVNCAIYAGGRKIEACPLDRISDALEQPEQFLWVGLYEPDEALLRKIQEEFGLHDLAIEDAHRAHQRPKVEMYGDVVFIVMRTAQLDGEGGIQFGESHFFLGSRFILSIRHGPSLAYAGVRSRCEGVPHLLRKGPGFALYALMDFVVDQYFPIIDAIEEELEIAEESVLQGSFSRATTARLHRLRRDLIEIKRAVSPLIDVCNKLVRFDLDLLPEDTRPYFRDVYDHVIRVNEIVDTLRELLSSAREANFSLLSIEQNEVSKKLASWAAIVAVPTLIAGVYGMNFDFMPELRMKYGYPAALCGILTVCVSLYAYFKHLKWL